MRSRTPLVLAAVAALVATALAGCIAPSNVLAPAEGDAEDVSVPEFTPPEVVNGLEVVAGVNLQGANELYLRDQYAYVSGYSGSHIINVSDPLNPELVASVDCPGIHVRVVELEERRVMTLAMQSDDGCPGASESGGIRLVDVTDPENPVVGPQVPLRFGSHTHTAYGDTGIIYNSAYNLANPFDHHRSEIIDITDFENPEVVGEFNFPTGSASHGCHDIWPAPELDRAYCAAITETQIWDTTDPLNPEVISIIRNPLLSIHHTATITRDGDLLIIGDEWTGAMGPGCFDGSGTAPIGAVWFYDVSDESNPQQLGYFAPPHQGPEIPCTAHNFNVVEGHDVLVAAFFRAGTVLIDFSDPANPTTIDQVRPSDTDVWAAYYHNGHVFTGDRARGFDVMAFT